MHRFAKWLVVLVTVGGFASTALASFTRVHTLGDGGRYFKDESGVRYYPQLVAEFADQFGLDVAKATNDTFVSPLDPMLSTVSGHLHLNTYWGIVLGVWASDYDDRSAAEFVEGFGVVDVAGGNIGFNPVGAAANRQWDILLGRAFDWGSVGLHILYGSATYSRSPAWSETTAYDPGCDPNDEQCRLSDKFKVYELGLQLGGSLKFSRLTLDTAFKYGAHGYSFKADGPSFPGSLSTGSEVEFLVRANWALSARWSIVPQFRVNYFSMKGTHSTDTGDGGYLPEEGETHRSISDLGLEFGAAFMLTPLSGMTVYIAPAIEYRLKEQTTGTHEVDSDDTVWNKTHTVKEEMLTLPSIRSGVEYQILDWMVLRAAFVKLISDTTKKDINKFARTPGDNTTVTTKTVFVPEIGDQPSNASYYYTLGMGLTFTHLFLDFELDPGYLTRGPYVLSGAGAPMFFQASATFTF